MAASVPYAYCIFEQPWWLEAVAPGRWDAIEIEEHGHVVARLPFTITEKYGVRTIGQPMLTQTLGPWVENSIAHEPKRLAREHSLYDRLIHGLPKFHIFRQHFHTSVQNWLPFYWQGFSQTTRYTYVIDGLSSEDKLFASLNATARNPIRKAGRHLSVVRDAPIQDVYRMASMTFARQGMATPYPLEYLQRIDEAVRKNAQRRAITVVDDDGRCHAAAYIVGDAARAYLLVTGADPSLRKSGAGYLAHWEIIKEASLFTFLFDFEGSMIKPIEAFYRKFAGHQTPYFAVTKNQGLVGKVMNVRSALNG